MKRAYILPAVALLGVVIAILAIIDTNRQMPAAEPTTAVGTAPFRTYVSGTGITETGRGNVAVGSPVPGIVSDLYVKVGDQVLAGNPLFKVDDRDLQARLAVARAKVAEADAALAKPRHRLAFLSSLQGKDRSAVSAQSISDVRDDARAAESVLGSANAEAAQIQVEISRSVVRAPTRGRVLQINTRLGEYVEGGGTGKPPMLLGDDSRVYLRVDIDENDAWRVRPQARAHASVRGNPQLGVALRFEYIEPVVAAKTSLTGQSTERSDVRVLQVIYSFARGALPVYLGQQMDVFIEAPPVPSAGGKR